MRPWWLFVVSDASLFRENKAPAQLVAVILSTSSDKKSILHSFIIVTVFRTE